MTDASIIKKAKDIKLVIFDVDGVLTDGTIYIGNGELELKGFNAHDGQGIALMTKSGIEVAIITARSSHAVIQRSRELGIKFVYQGQKNKVEAYENVQKKLNLEPNQIAYMGDDLPDIKLMKRSAIGATVNNGVSIVKENADWISQFDGGRGAAREFAELLLKAQDRYDDIIQQYL
tara:strand:+ start:30332 stop:30859 length:528 start_codon:yes stop_codon:yes gene_type:complete